jgi:hypothetical protein
VFVVRIALGDPKDDSCVFYDGILEGYVSFFVDKLFVLIASLLLDTAGIVLSLVGIELV